MASSELRRAARTAAGHAWCPYSRFPVGAALETRSGVIHAGCNVESASYGLSQCAERTALGTAVAAGMRPGEVLAVAVYTPGPRAYSCCGACRQVLLELAPGATVTSFCDGAEELTLTVEAALPEAFRLVPPGAPD